MTQPLSWLAILSVVGAGQGAFFTLSLFTNKRGSHTANRYLASLTLVFSCALLDDFLRLTALNQEFMELAILLLPREFFFGVFTYFYVRELTQPKPVTLSGNQWLHFLPAFLHVAIYWSLLLMSTDFRQGLFSSNPPQENSYTLLLWWFFHYLETPLIMTYLLIYLVLSFRLLHQHSHRIKQTFSAIDKINLRWISGLLIGVLGIYSIWVVGSFLPDSIYSGGFFRLSITLGMLTMLYTLGHFGLRQPQIFKPVDRLPLNEDARSIPVEQEQAPSSIEQSPAPAPEKYKNSPLNNELSLAIVDDIQNYMTTKKPYLDNQISLPQLAESLEIPIHYLSQTINEQLKQNFFDFINGYRIEEAKRRLASEADQENSVLTIAMEAGFNSKSSFYSAFKKSMGMTPTQYRKSIREAQ